MRRFLPLPLLLRTFLRARHPLALLRLWVLVWFLLSQGVAILAPVLGKTLTPMPQQLGLLESMQSFCTSMGTSMPGISLGALGQSGSWDGQDDERHGPEKTSVTGADCPWCSAVAAPPAAPTRLRSLPPHPLAYALQPIVAAHIVFMTAAALPARGPPVFSS